MPLKNFAFFLIIAGFLLAFWFLIRGGFIHASFDPAPERAKDIQPFMTGLVAPLFALAGTILVFENLRNQTNQQISNIFFGLINLHHKIVENISVEVYGINETGVECKGREFFDDLAFRIYVDYYNREILWKNEAGIQKSIQPVTGVTFENKVGKDRLVAIYFHYFHIYHSSLGHYFRNMFHIVKYVDESRLGKKQKKGFVKILRAQLSNYEILLLAFNGLSEYGEGFKPLIEKYEMLKNLNFEDNLSSEYIKRITAPGVLINEYPHLRKIYGTRFSNEQ